MGKTVLPSCLEKRKLLYSSHLSAEALRHYGDIFFEHGMLEDSLDFYEKSGTTAGIKRIEEAARKEGDAWLLERVSKAKGENIPREQWDELGENALRKKKYLYALFAFRKSGNQQRLSALRETTSGVKSQRETFTQPKR
ncbi:MAG: hypothetical protein GXO98_02315 [Nitrospirae bacterium]|nr:hypothetical protein [Nitrospirota bacterium]